MIIDGKQIATDMLEEVKQEILSKGLSLKLTVFTCAPDGATQSFLRIKKAKADQVGVNLNVIEFPEDVNTDEVVMSIKKCSEDSDGIIVQLPFPSHIDRSAVLEAVPEHLDVDRLNYDGDDSECLPPVVGAIKEIASRYELAWPGQKVVVIGEGLLVGKPAALWAARAGALVAVVRKDTENMDDILRSADIIISGAGAGGLITPDKIKPGVAIFDAGTSEESGVLKGDADPACADICSLFTPVPGGIGPITVAIIFRNLLKLSQKDL